MGDIYSKEMVNFTLFSFFLSIFLFIWKNW